MSEPRMRIVSVGFNDPPWVGPRLKARDRRIVWLTEEQEASLQRQLRSAVDDDLLMYSFILEVLPMSYEEFQPQLTAALNERRKAE